MEEKKEIGKRQAVSGMVVDDGWDPKRPFGHYPTQRAIAPCDDGKRGYRKPSRDAEINGDKELQALRKNFREKRLFQ